MKQGWEDEAQAMLDDPCAPFWVKRIVPELMQKDPVDVLGALDVLRAWAKRRAQEVLSSAT